MYTLLSFILLDFFIRDIFLGKGEDKFWCPGKCLKRWLKEDRNSLMISEVVYHFKASICPVIKDTISNLLVGRGCDPIILQ